METAPSPRQPPLGRTRRCPPAAPEAGPRSGPSVARCAPTAPVTGVAAEVPAGRPAPQSRCGRRPIASHVGERSLADRAEAHGRISARGETADEIDEGCVSRQACVTTRARPARGASRVPPVEVGVGVEAVQRHDRRCAEWRQGGAVSRTALIVPRPASATRTTRSGARAAQQGETVAVGGQGRTQPARRLDQTDVDRRSGPGNSAMRSPIVKGGRPQTPRPPSVAPSAISYQRCGGQTCSGGSPVAAPSTAASRAAGSSPGSKDCAGLRAATCRPAGAEVGQEAGGDPCLADVGPGADHGDHAAGTHAGQSATGGGRAGVTGVLGRSGQAGSAPVTTG